MKLLLVEDVPELAELTGRALAQQGFTVDMAGSLGEAETLLDVAPPDVIVLDLNLPDGDGLGLIARLRRARSTVPILVVSARGGLNERIVGLDEGADDYMVKPAPPAEIAARCRALLRRPGGLLGQILSFGNIRLDSMSRTATVAGAPLPLARREIDLLELMLRRGGTVVTRAAIENAVYSIDEAPGPNAIEASVSRLRRTLKQANADSGIQAIRGVGYLLCPDPSGTAP